ncbi:MAG TPA: PqqD family protein, partial [Vicinamibacterales bacterium]|nr:PqqD family protein [Vicinamibacterales bacterium]
MKASVARFLGQSAPTAPLKPNVYRRNPKIEGPMAAFGYDYFEAHYGKKRLALDPELRYEALNLVDGRRTAAEIRDALSAIYKDTPLAHVEEYLAALASIGVIIPSGTAP